MGKKTYIDLGERIRANMAMDASGCWRWTGGCYRTGYGMMGIYVGKKRKTVSAHRAAYEFFVGPIPADLEIDHLCRNRVCCNPAHLEPVTHMENVRRGLAFRAFSTHCVNGHPFDGQNTRFRKTPRGGVRRDCRACGRASYFKTNAKYPNRRRKNVACTEHS